MTRTELELIVYLTGACAAVYWLGMLLFEIRQNATAMRRRLEAQAEMDALPDRDYGRVRPRNNSVRLATLPELKELEMRKAARQAAYDRDEDERERRRARVAELENAPGLLKPDLGAERLAGSTPAPGANLVPFARGYAFTGFAKRTH